MELQAVVRGRRLGREGRGRFLREAAGLSLRDLAHAVGVDVATLSRWERGVARPRHAAAVRWVAACDEIERELNDRKGGTSNLGTDTHPADASRAGP
jgi:transcriptional regulator with XRE-family HTH domain